MVDNDLKAFEQSLRQLEFIADAVVNDVKKPNTREQRNRANDPDLAPGFMP